MSLLDKIFQGLGFEGETKPEPILEQNQVEKTQVLQDKFDLSSKHEPELVEESGLYEFKPKTQAEAKQAIDYLRDGFNIQIDFSGFSGSSLVRAMDFVQGASYALGATPRKIADKLFAFEYYEKIMEEEFTNE